MARAREAEPAIPGVQTIPNSSSHVIRCICSRQLGVKLRRARVTACVQCSSGRGLCLPSILAGMCHAAVVVSRQNVKIGKHHIMVDRTVFEKSHAWRTSAKGYFTMRTSVLTEHKVSLCLSRPDLPRVCRLALVLSMGLESGLPFVLHCRDVRWKRQSGANSPHDKSNYKCHSPNTAGSYLS